MNRTSFSSLISKGGKKMYGKKKPGTGRKKPGKKKRTY
jgi:hypothetical protein|tara:strand:- start:223 stop:336 length:114 start_codon:yes stop_codon:yes gene_type:complete